MHISYQQKCPSCGAPIIQEEADRLVKCGFCGINNYLVGKEVLRFVLPDKIPESIPDDDIFYIPYLRFKGTIFSHKGVDVQYRILDTTYRAISESTLPETLGVRPQAMPLQLLQGQSVRGRFVRRTEDIRLIFDRASLLIDLFSYQAPANLLHRAFIGETISIIYLPLYHRDNVVIDGVLNRVFKGRISQAGYKNSSQYVQSSWKPTYLATVCPDCGDGLAGEVDSLILHCHNCKTAWVENKGKFYRINWQAQPCKKRSPLAQLPFWRFTIKTAGIKMENLADFLRISNQPIAIQQKHEDAPLSIMVPAFKIQPKQFLLLSKRFTVTQIKIAEGGKEEYGRLFPVTLPLHEGVQALKSIIAAASVSKRKLVKQIGEMKIEQLGQELVYLDFKQYGNDLVQPQCGISLPISLLHMGKKI